MILKARLEKELHQAVVALYPSSVPEHLLTLQPTRKEFKGTYTLVTFPLASFVGLSAHTIGEALGSWLQANTPFIESYEAVGGFLNFTFSDRAWREALEETAVDRHGRPAETGRKVVLEIACPNTNKPLHLGHLRNTFLGAAVASLLEAVGHRVYRIQHINDRGIHICKSMVAYLRFGGGATPADKGMKGDHFVGDFYVQFDQAYKKEVEALVAAGETPEEARRRAPIMRAAQEMLQKWEGGDQEVLALWKRMNDWVYSGFEVTYQRLGLQFDKTYYESATYLLGKKVVEEELERGNFYREKDGAVWVDLEAEGLGKKLLLRGDGTAVYITQDIGTADLRFRDFAFDDSIYTVGNEQDYHFSVLFAVLKKIGRPYADRLYHLSYGMVDLPSGKMKSREGTVVEADTLLDKMVELAERHSQEQGKVAHFSKREADALYRMLGLGALKYFLLRVGPQKRILFDPQASIEFHGRTGPSIQYTHARIVTMLRKADYVAPPAPPQEQLPFDEAERALVGVIVQYREVLQQAADTYNPSLVAGYLYDLAKAYNHLYGALPVLREPEVSLRDRRLFLSWETAHLLRRGSSLLGIELPDKM